MDHNVPIGLNSTEWTEMNQIGPKWTEVDLMDRSKSNGIDWTKVDHHHSHQACNSCCVQQGEVILKKTIAISATVLPKSNKFEK